MVKASKPLRQSLRGHLGGAEPPRPDTAPKNLIDKPSAGLKDLNFKVDPPFHQQFKIEATARGMSMVDFLKEIFWHYIQTKPRQ